MSFDAFGKRRETNWAAMTNEAVATFDTSRTKRGFTGHEMIDPFGLVHMNGRVYEPEVGRFVSADPIVQDIENLQAYNRYTYVQNNPLTLTDPSGFYAVDDFSGPGSYSSPNFLLMNDTASKVDLNTKSNLGTSSAPLRSNADQEASGISNIRQATQDAGLIKGPTDTKAPEIGVFGNPALGSPSSSASSNERNGAKVAWDICFGNFGGLGAGGMDADGPLNPCFCGGGLGSGNRGRSGGRTASEIAIKHPGAARSMSTEQARRAVKTLQEIRARQNAHQKPDIKQPYKRPSNATTKEQRESVQGKPCVDCGKTTSKQHADHKEPLVKEYYSTGKIDKEKMRSLDSVQPQCPNCSNRQGGFLSNFSKQMKSMFGF